MDRIQPIEKSDLSRKVMERIINENRWAVPVHEQPITNHKSTINIGSLIAIVFLIGVVLSFLFLKPSPNTYTPSAPNDSFISIIKSTDFAKSFTNLGFSEIQEGMVASIGEPKLYHPHENDQTKLQLFLVIIILGLSMITLLMNWISNEDKNSNHT
ncbi:MAG: hypothetical protein ACH0QD_03795 [Tepidibacillus sp.]|uniref:hypothetical protein n=1 Tax=Tepidibacillus sp. HK-1 TaxID=1883407 RepID=UPI0008528D8A|nr:hypothetical protein [Tepidibacillus sp. HK-1]GBF11710.1 hypothetical protein HK1_01749 [Tepidibacillus sp. HK-1]